MTTERITSFFRANHAFMHKKRANPLKNPWVNSQPWQIDHRCWWVLSLTLCMQLKGSQIIIWETWLKAFSTYVHKARWVAQRTYVFWLFVSPFTFLYTVKWCAVGGHLWMCRTHESCAFVKQVTKITTENKGCPYRYIFQDINYKVCIYIHIWTNYSLWS